MTEYDEKSIEQRLKDRFKKSNDINSSVRVTTEPRKTLLDLKYELEAYYDEEDQKALDKLEKQ